MRFTEFKPEHAVGTKAHPDQASFQWMLEGTPLFDGQEVYSIFDGDDLIAIAGVVEFGGRSTGWILFTDKMRPKHFLPIHRRALRVALELEKIGDPLMIHVDPERPHAVRWAKLLGLNPDGMDIAPDGKVLRRMAS